jgi:type IV pilus assembly protein PilA
MHHQPQSAFTLIELMIVIAIIAIVAAIAIPNLLASRVNANESGIAASLHGGVLPAQVQFMAGGYQDADGDNKGEAGTLEALAGKVATTGSGVDQVHLLTGPLSTQAAGLTTRAAHSYNVRGYVPSPDGTDYWCDGDGNVLAAVTAAAKTSDNSERHFAVAAAPETYSTCGYRAFVMGIDGQVRSPSAVANINTWFTAAVGSTPNPQSTGDTLDTGVEDAYGGIDLSAKVNVATYPVFTR